MDLIDRAAAIETLGEPHPLDYNRISAVEKIRGLPSVEAVPLDKLCAWLETNCILSCVACEYLFGGQWCKQHSEVPYRCHRKEHWKNVLTKWMEGLDAPY